MCLNKNFKANDFILTDVVTAYANYYLYLAEQTVQEGKQFENNLYVVNFQKFWKLIEGHILTINEKEFEIPNIANIVLDLSQIDIELKQAWGYLVDITRLKIKEFDNHNFLLTLMGFSKAGLEDKLLWEDLKVYVKEHLNEFKIDELKKIILAFINIKESGELWKEIEKRLASEDILSDFNFDRFNDIQIPLALLSINNEKIWQKFEELLFKNLQVLQSDKDLLLNSIYSFSRIGRGSTVLWNKMCTILKSQMLNYDLEDQVHIVIFLKSNVITHNALTGLIDNEFWNSLMNSIEEKVPHANTTTSLNLSRALQDNEITAKNKSLLEKVNNRIDVLSKRR